MNRSEIADLLSEHGEYYDADGYHGCDCGYECSALEHPHHVAGLLVVIPHNCRCLWECGDRGGWLRLETHQSCPAHPAKGGA